MQSPRPQSATLAPEIRLEADALTAPSLTVAQAPFQRKLTVLEEARSDLQMAGIAVPGIVVCGDQSSGKSSLLTSLTGITFPRAEETCTRCPTIVRLQPDPRCDVPYAVIGSDSTLNEALGWPHARRVDKVEDIEGYISELSDKLRTSGDCGGFSEQAIHIKVVRPSGPSYTLIDLPGITRLAADGSKTDVGAVTTGLVRRYISTEEMVILVVVQANVDFQNAEAFRLAREADPEGQRTLGVVTKVDLCGTDSSRIIENIENRGAVRLRLGFVAVRNRTQKEIEDGVGLEAARAREKALFDTHDVLRRIDKQLVGVDALSRKISRLQARAIDGFIPRVVQTLQERVSSLEAELASLPPTAFLRFEECTTELALILHNVVGKLTKSMDGSTHWIGGQDTLSAQVDDAAQRMAMDLRRSVPDFKSSAMAAELRKEEEKYRGSTLSDVTDSRIIPGLVQKMVVPAFRECSDKFLQEVVEIVRPRSLELLIDEASVFPRATAKLMAELGKVLDECEGRARDFLATLVDAHGHVGDITGKYQAVVSVLTQRQPVTRMARFMAMIRPKCMTAGGSIYTRNRDLWVTTHQVALHVYSGLVLDALSDSVARAVRVIFFQGLASLLMKHLLERMSADPQILVNLMSNPEIEDERARRQRLLDTFNQHLPRLQKCC